MIIKMHQTFYANKSVSMEYAVICPSGLAKAELRSSQSYAWYGM